MSLFEVVSEIHPTWKNIVIGPMSKSNELPCHYYNQPFLPGLRLVLVVKASFENQQQQGCELKILNTTKHFDSVRSNISL
jgi:hypothetical protein